MTCLQSQRSGFLVSAATVLAALVALQPQASRRQGRKEAERHGCQSGRRVARRGGDGLPLKTNLRLAIPIVADSLGCAGRFTFEDVQPGTYRLFAESGNQISSRQWGASSSAQSLRLKAEQVTVSSNEVPRPMTLRLVEGCRFRVSVKRAADNRPIANAKIRFPWGEIDRHYDTDSNGVVMIEGLRPEEWVFQVRAGYALGEKRLEKTQPGTTTDLSFSLGPGGAVEGTVHDVDGRPLFNVRVGATAKRAPAELHIGTSKTDGKGRFKIENVPTGEPIELSVSQKDYLRKEQPVTLKPDQKVLTVDLVLERRPRGGSVFVTVTGPDAKPVANARLVNPARTALGEDTAGPTIAASASSTTSTRFFGRHELGVTAKGFAPVNFRLTLGRPENPPTCRWPSRAATASTDASPWVRVASLPVCGFFTPGESTAS